MEKVYDDSYFACKFILNYTLRWKFITSLTQPLNIWVNGMIHMVDFLSFLSDYMDVAKLGFNILVKACIYSINILFFTFVGFLYGRRRASFYNTYNINHHPLNYEPVNTEDIHSDEINAIHSVSIPLQVIHSDPERSELEIIQLQRELMDEKGPFIIYFVIKIS